MSIPRLVRCYKKFIKNFARIAKPLTLLTHHKAKFQWTPVHHTAFMTLKEAIIQTPILCYPDPAKKYIVYTGTQWTKFWVEFLSHTFIETQRKWSAPEWEAYGVYYAITKWNYYLQGSDIIVHKGHKPLAKFLNGKNANNKVNRWGLELATYNIMLKWISEARNKAADCLHRLINLPNNTKATDMMPTATNLDGPAFNKRSQTSQQCQTTKDKRPSNTLSITSNLTTVETAQDITLKTLLAERHKALLQMQRTGNIHSVNVSQRDYPMARHHSMRLIYLQTLKEYYTNTS